MLQEVLVKVAISRLLIVMVTHMLTDLQGYCNGP